MTISSSSFISEGSGISQSSTSEKLIAGHASESTLQPKVTIRGSEASIKSVNAFGTSLAVSRLKDSKIRLTDGFICSLASFPPIQIAGSIRVWRHCR